MCRVQKRTAKRLYYEGNVVYLCPCKMRPGEPWYPEVGVSLGDGDFEMLVNEFAAHNCSIETGREIDYYVVR